MSAVPYTSGFLFRFAVFKKKIKDKLKAKKFTYLSNGSNDPNIAPSLEGINLATHPYTLLLVARNDRLAVSYYILKVNKIYLWTINHIDCFTSFNIVRSISCCMASKISKKINLQNTWENFYKQLISAVFVICCIHIEMREKIWT